MKKLLAFLLLALVLALSRGSLACTKAQPNGSAGNANNPATGFITAIVANGSSNLTVTYNGTVQTTVGFYSTNVSITGSWSGTKITTFAVGNPTSNPPTSYFSIDGVHAINFSGMGLIGASRTFAGTGGGLTGITGLGLGQINFTVDGVNNGSSVHGTFGAVSPAGCTFDVQDLGAVGLMLMPSEKPRARLWWDRY